MKTLLATLVSLAFATSALAFGPQQVTGGGQAVSSLGMTLSWTLGGTMQLTTATAASTAQLQMIDPQGRDIFCDLTNIHYDRKNAIITLTPSECAVSDQDQNPPVIMPSHGDLLSFSVAENPGTNDFILTAIPPSSFQTGSAGVDDGAIDQFAGTVQVY
jgi:hypothetical protein